MPHQFAPAATPVALSQERGETVLLGQEQLPPKGFILRFAVSIGPGVHPPHIVRHCYTERTEENIGSDVRRCGISCAPAHQNMSARDNLRPAR